MTNSEVDFWDAEISSWFDARVDTSDPEHRTIFADLYEDFRKYRKLRTGRDSMPSMKCFGSWLRKKRGLLAFKSGTIRFSGVRLRPLVRLIAGS